MRTRSLVLNMNHDKALFSSTMIRKIMISLMLLFSAYLTQGRELLDVPVKLDVENGSTDGVTVNIIKNGIPAGTVEGKKKMNLSLEFNRNYTIVFKKQNYISKSIEFDTHVSSARIESGFEPYGIGVKLFQQSDKENMIVYNQAVAHIGFDKTLDAFSYETDYSKSVLSNIEEEDENSSDDIVKEKKITLHPAGKKETPEVKNLPSNLASSASGMNHLASSATTKTSVPDKNELINSVKADFNSGVEIGTDQNLFDQVTASTYEITERNRVITVTTVVKGNVSTEYRRVVYQWGGVYFFKDNNNSISEELYALRTNVNTLK